MNSHVHINMHPGNQLKCLWKRSPISPPSWEQWGNLNTNSESTGITSFPYNVEDILIGEKNRGDIIPQTLLQW